MTKKSRLINEMLMNLAMATAMSFAADIKNGTLSLRTLLMIPVGFAVGMLVSYLVPYGKIAQTLCRKAKAERGSLPAALLSGIAPAILNTLVIGAVMTAINVPLAVVGTAGYFSAYFSTLWVLIPVAYVVGVLVKPLADKASAAAEKSQKRREKHMNLMIIGANGRLGGLLVKKALDEGNRVTAVVPDGTVNDPRVERVLNKSLFDLTKEDVSGFDAVLSAFGSGFSCDPAVNRQAIDHMIMLLSGTTTAYVTVGGSGSLYTDGTRLLRVYESPSHPEILRGISRQLFLGLGDLKASKNLDWTFVCPSLSFVYDAPETGRYTVGENEEVVYGKDGQSHVSYADFAAFMVEEARTRKYAGKCVTVYGDVPEKGGTL